jgi:hypothetical protein
MEKIWVLSGDTNSLRVMENSSFWSSTVFVFSYITHENYFLIMVLSALKIKCNHILSLVLYKLINTMVAEHVGSVPR